MSLERAFKRSALSLSAVATCIGCTAIFDIEQPEHAQGGSSSTGGTATSSGGSSSTGGTGATSGGTGATSGGTGATSGGTSSSDGGSSASGGSENQGGDSAGSGGSPDDTDPCGGIAIPMGDDPDPLTGGIWATIGDPDVQGWNSATTATVLVDPVRATDFYAVISGFGVWKSTSSGWGWDKVNTGPFGSLIDENDLRSAAIETNRCRDPGSPPTLYVPLKQNTYGLLRSDDGGVGWTPLTLPDNSALSEPQDAESISVDPYDSAHLIMGYHGQPGFIESTDAGDSWNTVDLDPGMDDGVAWYGFFIDTGHPSTTRNTWFLMPEDDGNPNASVSSWLTTDGGDIWTKKEDIEHLPGHAQVLQRDGVVYVAGTGPGGNLSNGVYSSPNLGVSWFHATGTGDLSVVYGTASHMYAQNWASSSAWWHDGSLWQNWDVGDSGRPTDGLLSAAVTYSGTSYIILAAYHSSGLWVYVEP